MQALYIKSKQKVTIVNWGDLVGQIKDVASFCMDNISSIKLILIVAVHPVNLRDQDLCFSQKFITGRIFKSTTDLKA